MEISREQLGPMRATRQTGVRLALGHAAGPLVFLTLMILILGQITLAPAEAAQSSSTEGVTDSAIHVGVTYPDISALKGIINVDPGNYNVAYTTLFDQINAHGGLGGRKIVPTFAAVDPTGTAGAAKACTQLTEDDKVFVVMGFFQAADVDCYTSLHGVPIIGASLSTAQAAAAKAAWFNNIISDSDLIPKEMALFSKEGVFKGKKVAVVDEAADAADMNLVMAALKKLKVDVVQTATNSAPTSDRVAQDQQFNTIAEKFQSVGANEVVAVGNAGNGWPRALQDNQSTYLPRLVASTYIDLDAYVEDSSGHSNAVLKNAITAGGYPPVAVVWNDPAMKKCVATIQAKEPKAKINNPVTATASTPVTWTAPEVACQQVALFTDIVHAAGKNLTNASFKSGGTSLTHVTIPGGGGTFNFSHGHGDGNGPVFVFQWDPTANKLTLQKNQ